MDSELKEIAIRIMRDMEKRTGTAAPLIRIPLSWPDITQAEADAVLDVLLSGRLSLGPKLAEFERIVAEYCGLSHAVAVNSGTSGLHLAVRALGIEEGDEVITSSFSFVASANAIRYERARPVFVDIDPETMNVDAGKIEAAITGRTKAIMLVHVFGRPAPLNEVMAIARRHNLAVIEDACEALGAEYNAKKVGGFGRAGVFAFYPNKQITTGEGGVIVTGDARIAELARQLRNQGRDPSADWYEHTELGYNYRIPELSCAIGIEQMKRIDGMLDRRRQIARKYAEILGSNPDIVTPPLEADGKMSWFVFVVRLADHFGGEDRDWMVREMASRGIQCQRYFAPIHLQPLYRRSFGYRAGDLPVTERVARRTIALPFFNRITDEEIVDVCDNLAELITLRKDGKA
jgi:perosamine synthetase